MLYDEIMSSVLSYNEETKFCKGEFIIQSYHIATEQRN